VKYLVLGASAAVWAYLGHAAINGLLNNITTALLHAVAH
jgi:hypothetical protein